MSGAAGRQADGIARRRTSRGRGAARVDGNHIVFRVPSERLPGIFGISIVGQPPNLRSCGHWDG
jgi:hypothetical protein